MSMLSFLLAQATLTLSSILGEIIQVQKLPYSGTFMLDVTNIPDGVIFIR